MARGKRDDTDGGWLRRSNKTDLTDIVHARNTLETAKKAYLEFCKMRDKYEGDTSAMEEQKWTAYQNAYQWAQHVGAIEDDH